MPMGVHQSTSAVSSLKSNYSLQQPSTAKKVGFFAIGALALIGATALGAVLGGCIHESFIDSAKYLSNTLLKGIIEMKPWALATLGGLGVAAVGCGVLAASRLNPKGDSYKNQELNAFMADELAYRNTPKQGEKELESLIDLMRSESRSPQQMIGRMEAKVVLLDNLMNDEHTYRKAFDFRDTEFKDSINREKGMRCEKAIWQRDLNWLTSKS